MTEYVLSEPMTTVVEGGQEIYAAKVRESLGTRNGKAEAGTYIGWRNFSSEVTEGEVLETKKPLTTTYKPSESEEGKKKGWVVALARSEGEIAKDALIKANGGSWAKMSAMIAKKGEAVFASQIAGHTEGV